jgi:hypothetical protein
VTGQPVAAQDLISGDRIHIEPHQVYSKTVGHQNDVEVTGTEEIGELVTVSWRQVEQYLGSDPAVSGATVYRHGQIVVRFSHVDVAA